jgi:glycosyltransferase involved in cell wall biosynthesis
VPGEQASFRNEFVTDPRLEPAPIHVWSEEFTILANSLGLPIENCSAEAAASSEAGAARFVLALLRRESSLRARFPYALSEGDTGRFCHWLSSRGSIEFGLSLTATENIRAVFRGQWSKAIYDIYLNDPDLQRLYPLGLLSLGQRHFLEWLITHGRADQRLTFEQILWFLYESSEEPLRGFSLAYLLQPVWQKYFPAALRPGGWAKFRAWLCATYGEHLRAPLPEILPIGAPDVSAAEGVNILSHFCNPSGIQQAALWTKAALERAGFQTSCRDVPVPRRIIPGDREDWLGLEVFPITILTHAAAPYFESGYQRAGLFPRDNVYRIAYWAWELEAIPDEWVEVAHRVQEIWSPTEFVAQAMRVRMPRPVYRMLPGVGVGPIEAVTRASLNIPEDHFVFLFMFDLHSQIHRKNPVGVFRAFKEAFRADDKTTLIIKTTGGDIHSKDLAEISEIIRGPNVILLDELFSRARAYGLIAMADCFVSLHRSEGFGLGLAEAMLLGKPVIATGYSGNLDFMSHDNSLLVDYELVEISEDRPIYTRGNRWAEPSITHAASLMRNVYEHPNDAWARAARARPEIEALLSLQKAGERMRARLEEIEAGPRG